MPENSRNGARKVSPEPLYDWAMREKASSIIRSLLEDMSAASRGYVREDDVKKHFNDAIRKSKPLGMTFWWTLTLEMWLRRLEEAQDDHCFSSSSKG